eukprot:CAMPEP_0197009192 /NCGR_PEP_ID=MMETSP1380-20130617/48899_1 /TAXON_ID=5936 /ORGANISM="Euplotes crassus, Strain CT5" /LENGTH=61 /DNA_ID=CAMNT_0042430271 /DNA_START=207 /DNA_END=392 /DNA_ORIENTATION=-
MNGRNARAKISEIMLAIIIKTMLNSTKKEQSSIDKIFIIQTINVNLESQAWNKDGWTFTPK